MAERNLIAMALALLLATGLALAQQAPSITIEWHAGARAPAEADWVEPLMKAPKNVVAPEPDSDSDSLFGGLIVSIVQLFFLLVPLSSSRSSSCACSCSSGNRAGTRLRLPSRNNLPPAKPLSAYKRLLMHFRGKASAEDRPRARARRQLLPVLPPVGAAPAAVSHNDQ